MFGSNEKRIMTKVFKGKFPISIKSNDLDFCRCSDILEYSLIHHAYGIFTGIAFIPIVDGLLYDNYRHKFDIVFDVNK